MALSVPPTNAQQPCHVRCYPLDIDLPFRKYDHRRLDVRDILVHRVMHKFLFPGTKELAQAFETHRIWKKSLHNFAPIKRYDADFGRDLELLRKMLTTCSITDTPYTVSLSFENCFQESASPGLVAAIPPRLVWPSPLEEEGKVRVTVGQEILDLVRRHYMEKDDACLRLWLQAIQLPRASSYNTLPKALAAKETHIALVQKRKRQFTTDVCKDEKKWYPEDFQHLAALQARVQSRHLPVLYSGGSFLPALRQPLLSSKVSRVNYLARAIDLDEDLVQIHDEDFYDPIVDWIYPWPEGQAPRRVLQVPPWGSKRHRKRWLEDTVPSRPVDFASGRIGRGRDRDGIWSTARRADCGAERGRAVRPSRRRATSEPPHGMFTLARLPLTCNHLRGLLTFPQMTVATMYQRSRRRSLSRTRIAEMFDWSTGSTEDGGREKRQDQAQNATRYNYNPVEFSYEHSVRLQALSRLVQEKLSLHETNPENTEWVGLSKVLEEVIGDTIGSDKTLNPCENCASRHYPDCTKPCGYCGAPSPRTSFPEIKLLIPRPKVITRFIDEEAEQGAGHHSNAHLAPKCPVAKHNRCKCGPFPQYHVAARCAVLCSRECGNGHPAGHFKHKNAMTCKARCCMCGIKGHSGSQCKLKTCRCGGAHLGQDCTWKVECRVKGCYRFLCGLHCMECGMSRTRLEEGARFEDRKCPLCLMKAGKANDVVVGEGPSQQLSQRDNQRARRRNQRSQRDPNKSKEKQQQAQLPWYAPLQPRTRPVVVSKSGKKLKNLQRASE